MFIGAFSRGVTNQCIGLSAAIGVYNTGNLLTSLNTTRHLLYVHFRLRVAHGLYRSGENEGLGLVQPTYRCSESAWLL